jgi:multisubunit Na+/H+ antiporter MnhG subunit
MSTVALALSILLAALGTLGLVSPQRLADLARRLLTPGGLVLAAVTRILFGVVLVFAAPNVRVPELCY